MNVIVRYHSIDIVRGAAVAAARRRARQGVGSLTASLDTS